MRRTALIIFGSCLLFTVAACTSSPLTNPIRKEVTKYHYVALELPDARVRPGSIIVVDPSQGLRWLGYLDDCGVPSNLLVPTPDPIGDMTQNMKDTYDASAVLKIKGVSVGPQWNLVKSVDLSLSGVSSPAIDLINLMIWLSDPNHQKLVATTCNTILSQPNTYVVSESLGAAKGTYTLKGTNSVKIAVKGLTSGAVSLDPNADATIDSGGSLDMKSQVYFGVKRVKRVDAATLITLGQGAQVYDDVQLEEQAAKVQTQNQ